MLRPLLFVAAALTLVVSACSGPPPPARAAEERPFASVCDEANHGQLVAVRGFFRLPEESTGDYSVVLRLHETPDAGGAPVLVSVPYGYEPHHMASIPTTYSDADLKVYTADDDSVGVGDAVRVSGRVYEPMVDQGDGIACGLESAYVERG